MKKFFLVTGLLFALIFFFIATDIGLRTTYQIARLFIPGKLVIKELRGNLMTRIAFDEMTYSDQSTQISMGTFFFDWRPGKLIFSRRLSINNIQANNLNILLRESGKASKPAATTNKEADIKQYIQSFVAALQAVEIKHAYINELNIQQNSKSMVLLEQLIISPNQQGQQQIHIESSLGNISGNYSINYGSDFSWNIRLASDNLNLKPMIPQASSLFQFEIHTQGVWNKSTQKAEFTLPVLKGKIDKYPLAAAADIDWQDDRLIINELFANFGHASLEVASNKTNNDNLSWRLDIPQLAAIAPGIRAKISSQGDIRHVSKNPELIAKIHIQHLFYDVVRAKDINAEINTTTQDGIRNKTTVLVKEVGNNQFLLPWIRIDSNTQFIKTNLNNKMQIALDDNNYLSGELTLENLDFAKLMHQRIYGQFSVHFSDLSKLNSAFAASQLIQSLKGQVSGDVNINGYINKPQINAKLIVSNGSLLVTAFGSRLDNLSLRASYQHDQPLHFDSKFILGGGKASLGGVVDFQNQKLSANLALNGDNLLLMDTKEYKVYVSPDLKVNYANNLIHLTGSVLVPEAQIEPKDFSSTTELPNDVVIVNQKKKDRNIATNLDMSLRVTLGDKVLLDFYNLKARVTGGLNIRQNPGNPPTATGEISLVDGEYKAYGKHLIIERGRLVYTGNLLSNPGIDLRAYQTMSTSSYAGSSQFDSTRQTSYVGQSELKVGVDVHGTLKKPSVSFYSQPAGLSQGDILSYLLVGRPQRNAGGGSLALLGAAAGLAPGGGDSVGDLQNKLGLDDLSLGTTEYYDPDAETAADAQKKSKTVNVGKHIGENLTVHLSQGVLDPIAVLNIRYQINKYFSIQTQASAFESAGDILYHLESEE